MGEIRQFSGGVPALFGQLRENRRGQRRSAAAFAFSAGAWERRPASAQAAPGPPAASGGAQRASPVIPMMSAVAGPPRINRAIMVRPAALEREPVALIQRSDPVPTRGAPTPDRRVHHPPPPRGARRAGSSRHGQPRVSRPWPDSSACLGTARAAQGSREQECRAPMPRWRGHSPRCGPGRREPSFAVPPGPSFRRPTIRMASRQGGRCRPPSARVGDPMRDRAVRWHEAIVR